MKKTDIQKLIDNRPLHLITVRIEKIPKKYKQFCDTHGIQGGEVCVLAYNKLVKVMNGQPTTVFDFDLKSVEFVDYATFDRPQWKKFLNKLQEEPKATKEEKKGKKGK